MNFLRTFTFPGCQNQFPHAYLQARIFKKPKRNKTTEESKWLSRWTTLLTSILIFAFCCQSSKQNLWLSAAEVPEHAGATDSAAPVEDVPKHLSQWADASSPSSCYENFSPPPQLLTTQSGSWPLLVWQNIRHCIFWACNLNISYSL